jgi:hypothetical protein
MDEKKKIYPPECRPAAPVPVCREIPATALVIGEERREGPCKQGINRRETLSAEQCYMRSASRFTVSMNHALSDPDQLKGRGFHFHTYSGVAFIP